MGIGYYLIETRTNLLVDVKEATARLSKLFSIDEAFKIKGINIISDDDSIANKITAEIQLDFPKSASQIDVETLRNKVEKISFVRNASVRITADGFIEIVVLLRDPVVIHRIGNRYVLLDLEGREVDQLESRAERLDLPLIVGLGAENYVSEALTILLEAKDLVTRVRGLVRIGERRWDIILDQNQRIYLPEQNSLTAMKKIIALHEGQRILDREIDYLDFRDINRPMLGLTEQSEKLLRGLRNLLGGKNV
tara:strand:+ start:66 stop:818 length:753 start_codon:yes stop_codon:yes gene_type:complete